MADLDNLKTVNIIKYLQSKNLDGSFSSPSYLGSEARFVSPTKNTNLHNLEEELLLGCDTITEQWIEDNGDIKISIQYHDDSKNSYYLLESTIYKENVMIDDYIILKEDILNYVNNDVVIKIAKKQTFQKDDNGKIITKEKITKEF